MDVNLERRDASGLLQCSDRTRAIAKAMASFCQPYPVRGITPVVDQLSEGPICRREIIRSHVTVTQDIQGNGMRGR